MSSVKVAVRVRPFNKREKDRKAKLIIQMKDKSTEIVHPGTKKKRRTVNFSRYGGLGNHRTPIGFSGDTLRKWDTLDYQVFFTPRAAPRDDTDGTDATAVTADVAGVAAASRTAASAASGITESSLRKGGAMEDQRRPLSSDHRPQAVCPLEDGRSHA